MSSDIVQVVEDKYKNENYLANVLDQIKKRNGDNLIETSEGKDVLYETNQLLKTGILNELLKAIKEEIVELSKALQNQLNANDTAIANKKIHLVRLKVDIIFFSFYQTQIEEDEAKSLLKLIKFISDILVNKQYVPSVQVQFNPTNIVETYWYPTLYTLLVILQLAHACAMQQTTYLLNRNIDYAHFTSIKELTEGNALPQIPGSRCGLELSTVSPTPTISVSTSSTIEEEEWLCAGARGFACLVFAIFRQPEVDLDRAPVADVEWFLHEACQLRAYSYIRLCMLPVLRTTYLQDKEISMFYIDILCELLENLSKIFCMTHYRQKYAHNENDFPYVFFPPTLEFYAQNLSFYSENISPVAMNEEVDSLDDVMSLYTALLEIRPEFAHKFWPSSLSGDIQAQQQSAAAAMQNTHHHDIVDHYYHPFIMKAIDASFHHPLLMLNAIRFMAALSNSPLGRTAYAGYLFVLDSTHQRFSWDFFFESIDKIAAQLGASLTMNALAVPGVGRFSALGAGSISIGADYGSLSSKQQSLVRSSAGFHLVEKDVEGLIAIMKLLGAVGVHPDVAALLHETYHPVTRLFALLSCPLPMSLKGAIFNTLASFARGSALVSYEIWQLIEAHRLLPISGAVLSKTGGGSLTKGIRVELEEAETRAGRYPITEGFLHLLDALLSHGTPDNSLGYGYRRPGLMVYLDYVIDDILLKSHERHYAPKEWPSACAQRWKLTALSLNILCTLLQQYPINAVPAESILMTATLDQPDKTNFISEMLSDFREDMVDYTISSFNTNTNITESITQKCLRPKTAGFTIMALLLNKSKLFDYLKRLLSECSSQAMEKHFFDHCFSEIEAAVDLLQALYQESYPENIPSKSENMFDFSSIGMGAISSKGNVAAAAASKSIQERLLLSELGREEHLCDTTFWQERTLAGIIGLIYECALREDTFMSLYRSCNTQLTITRSSDYGHLTVSPVIAHDFSDLLTTGPSVPMVSLIAQVVPMQIRSCPCLPALHVISVRILEHVALHLSPLRLIATLLPDSNWNAKGSSLVEGCVAAIQIDGNITAELNHGSLHYDVICLGGGALPNFFSISNAYTRELYPPNLYLTMINADSTLDAVRVDKEYVNALQKCASIREAVLHLLLTTLTPKARCLSHQLLGFEDDGVNLNACLGAILNIMKYENSSLGTTFLQLNSEQAVDCFELIYRLIASPITSKLVIKTLCDRRVDYFRTHLTILLYLMHLKDEELYEGSDITGNVGANQSRLDIFEKFEDTTAKDSSIQKIKTAICNCCAWLLKTCTILLRQNELENTTTSLFNSSEILKLLYSKCSVLSFAKERCSELSILEKIIEYATSFNDFKNLDFRVFNVLDVQAYVDASTIENHFGKAGLGWGNQNQFHSMDLSSNDLFTYQVIDLRALSSTMKNKLEQSDICDDDKLISEKTIQSILEYAVFFNICNKKVAAQSQLAKAWCQFVDVSINSNRSYETLVSILSADIDDNQHIPTEDFYSRSMLSQPIIKSLSATNSQIFIQRLFNQLFIPIASVLILISSDGSLSLPNVQLEAFARVLLSIVNKFTNAKSLLKVQFSEYLFLQPAQYQRMLQLIVQLLFAHRETCLSMSEIYSVSSKHRSYSYLELTSYRGILYAALTAIIRAPSKWLEETRSSKLNDSLSSDEVKSQYLENIFDKKTQDVVNDKYRQSISAYQSVIIEVLEEAALEVVDILAKDAVISGGAIVWRICSLSALSEIFQCLGSSDYKSSNNYSELGKRGWIRGEKPASGSYMYLQVLQLLVKKGYLNAITTVIGSLNNDISSVSSNKSNKALFISTINLCSQIVSSVEGADALLSSNLMERVIALPYFLNPPPFRDELVPYFAEDAHIQKATSLSREESLIELYERFSAVVNLIRCLFAAHPSSQHMAVSASEFLNKNRSLVSQLLRLHYLSLNGLAMTDAVTSILTMISAVPTSNLHLPHMQVMKSPRDEQSSLRVVGGIESSSIFSILGYTIESVIAESISLLGIIGSHPIPSIMMSSIVDFSHESNNNWWVHFHPASSSCTDSLEHKQSTTPLQGLAAVGMPTAWTVYDDKKLQHGLNILTNISMFFRLISSSTVHDSAQALQSVKLKLIIEVFCKCAALSLQLSQSLVIKEVNPSIDNYAANKNQNSVETISGIKWLRSPQSLNHSMMTNFNNNNTESSAPSDKVHSSNYIISSSAASNNGYVLSGIQNVSDNLLHIAENLICMIHNLIANNQSQLAQYEFETIERIVAKFPSHSLIQQVARWFKLYLK